MSLGFPLISIIALRRISFELFEIRRAQSKQALCLQGTINCAILGSGIGGSGDPRRKWEEMGEREREREREGEREKKKSVASVCKMI